MTQLDDILAQARKQNARIVLAEGEDPRIVEGAIKAKTDGIATPILLGDSSVVADKVSAAGADPSDFEIIDPLISSKSADYASAFETLRKHKGVDAAAAKKAMQNPLNFAAMMVRSGDADGSVAGAVATTSDTVRAALQIIGVAPNVATVSSFFLMLLDQPHHVTKGAVVFADCGLVVEPNVEELATIAIASADSYRQLVGQEPRVAMLSFSTRGSAKHPKVEHVAAATTQVKNLRPDLLVDGDLQFDAAFVPEVAATKAKDSPLAGAANVLVFPNLEAGNIGYKIAQRIGGAKAIGPILQGLAHPANDLSRGCSAEDVYNLIAVTAVQASSA